MEDNFIEIEKPKVLSYYFSGEINEEQLKDFVFFSNSVDGPLDFYFSSNGGFVSDYNILLHCLDKLENVTIIPSGEISSCAFLLVLNTKHKIELIDEGLYICVHFPRKTVNLDFNNKIINGSEESLKIYKEKIKSHFLTQTLRNINIPLKKKRDLLKGRDVFLTVEELKILLDGKLINS